MRPLLLSALLLLLAAFAPVRHHRQAIKTSQHQHTHRKTVAMDALLQLADAPGVSNNDARYEDHLIPAFNNPLGVKEGQFIAVTGYIHLVAAEANDGDYHIQMSNSAGSGAPCVIVEIPDPAAVTDPWLKGRAERARTFVRDRLLNGREPSAGGNVMQHPPHVRVGGQLFFDSSHVGTPPRGKRGMKASTLWEVHPVSSVEFVP